jgi:hypothetical protein
MRRFIKLTPIITGLLGLFLAVIAFVPALTQLFQNKPILDDPAKQLEVILGFVVLIVTCVVTIWFQQLEASTELREEQQNSRRANRRLIKAVGLAPRILSDQWLRARVDELCRMRNESLKHPHVDEAIELTIENTFAELNAAIHSPSFHKIYTRLDEWGRMERLLDIVAKARTYIHAVTLDSGDYIPKFWTGRYADKYWKTNEDAVNKRKVKVARIFVVDRDVIDNEQNEKRRLLTPTLQAHQKLGALRVQVVAKDKLPEVWIGHDTSFLVCDGVIASESYTLSAPDAKPGYVILNDRDAVAKLVRLFDALQLAPDENWLLNGAARS